MLCGLCLSTIVFAGLMGEGEVKDYKDFKLKLEEIFKYHKPEHTLLVLDNDNTLTTMPQALGGDAWWNWQMDLLKHDPNSPDLVGADFSDIFQVQKVLFGLSQMKLTDPEHETSVLTWLQDQGAKIMILTARGYPASQVTYDQLRALHYEEITKLNLEKDALSFSGATSLPLTFMPCDKSLTRPVAYFNGIYYAAGQNKGLLLQCLLPKSDQAKQIDTIVFLDDTLKNVQDFAAAYAPSNSVIPAVYVYHYTNTKHIVPLDKKQAAADWQRLKRVVGTVIAKPFYSG